MGRIGCPETSVQNYYSTLRSIPEVRGSHLHRLTSPKRELLTFHFTHFIYLFIRSLSFLPSFGEKQR
jgi:hypothetical protein